MGTGKADKKMAYHIGNKFLCEDCLTEEESKNLKEENIVTGKDLAKPEDIFCDKCKMKIG